MEMTRLWAGFSRTITWGNPFLETISYRTCVLRNVPVQSWEDGDLSVCYARPVSAQPSGDGTSGRYIPAGEAALTERKFRLGTHRYLVSSDWTVSRAACQTWETEGKPCALFLANAPVGNHLPITCYSARII